jgi:hypothetical protein
MKGPYSPLNVKQQRVEPDDMLNVLGVFTTAEDEPSPFGGTEMLGLGASLEQRALATGDQTGITVEFPLPGAVPPKVGVLRLQTTSSPHPS